MSRYYYRPIDPNYEAMAEGIMSGAGAIAQGIVGRKQRKEQDERQARADQYQDLQVDLRLAELGGGRGPAPTQTRVEGFEPMDFGEIPRTMPEPDESLPRVPRLNPASWMQNPSAAPRRPGLPEQELAIEPFDAAPAPGAPRMVAEQDPDFMNLADGAFHVLTPDARADRAAARDARAKDAERTQESADLEAEVARVASALREQNPDLDEATAAANARLIVEDAANFRELFPDAEDADPLFDETGTSDWATNVARLGELERLGLGGGSSGSRGVTPTSRYTQVAGIARSYLNELQALEDRAFNYTDVTEEELAAARARLTDIYGFASPEQARRVILEADRADGGLDGMSYDELYPESDEPAVEDEDTDEGFGPDTMLSPAEVAQFRARLKLYPDRTHEEKLRAAGLSDSQIQQITGRPARGGRTPNPDRTPRG